MVNWSDSDYEAYRKKVAQVPIPEPLPPVTATLPLYLTSQPSTDESALNKTERAFLKTLRVAGHQWVGVQNITLKLANDTRYTVDFVVITQLGSMEAYEVKGFFRDDAKVKIKVAARLFPWITFVVVYKGSKTDGVEWIYEKVKP